MKSKPFLCLFKEMLNVFFDDDDDSIFMVSSSQDCNSTCDKIKFDMMCHTQKTLVNTCTHYYTLLTFNHGQYVPLPFPTSTDMLTT